MEALERPVSPLQGWKLRHGLAGNFLVPLSRQDEMSKHYPPTATAPRPGNRSWLQLSRPLIPSHCQGVRGQWGLWDRDSACFGGG